MILYFPVSALMTLFANILNNPLDPRAKSDIRLMNLVVTFLSMLGQEAEQGGVHRMLGVCAEFERIANSVIEKAEKEQSSRRKRKNPDSTKAASSSTKSTTGSSSLKPNESTSQAPLPSTAATPTPGTVTANPTLVKDSESSNLSPMQGTDYGTSYSPMSASISGRSPSMASSGGRPQELCVPQNGDFDSFTDVSGFPSTDSPSAAAMEASFQQPLLPADLFTLPMTLDWNWAELSGGAYPTVENGNFGGDSVIQNGQQQHQEQHPKQ